MLSHHGEKSFSSHRINKWEISVYVIPDKREKGNWNLLAFDIKTENQISTKGKCW